MTSFVIKNGTLLDPSAAFARNADLLVRDGRIAAIDDDLEADEVLDATGQYVCPGLIDLHTHLREPGEAGAETIVQTCHAAAAGGYTGVCAFPDTDPPLDNEGQIEFVIRQAQRERVCRVYPFGSLTKNNDGKELAEIGSMHRRGALAFADNSRASAAVMRKALQYAKTFDTLVIQQAEEPTLGGGVMHAGDVSTRLGLTGTPAEAEALILARDLLLNKPIGCRYHATAVSTALGLDQLRGSDASCDVTVAHLLYDHTACESFDPYYKVRPPLRTRADVDALIAGIRTGRVHAISTGHRPCRPDEKDRVFPEAADGMRMLEDAVGLATRALIEPGHIDWLKLIDLMSTRPAQLLRLGDGRGTLTPGSVADLTLILPTPGDDPSSARITRTLQAGRCVFTARTA